MSKTVASPHSQLLSVIPCCSNSSDSCNETGGFFPLRDPPLIPSESLVATFFPLALCLGEMLAPSCYCWEDNYLKLGAHPSMGSGGGEWDLRSMGGLSYPTAEMGPSHF